MEVDISYTSASLFRSTLYVVLWTLLFKYICDKFRRDARFVKFAATLPGPPDIPLIGNGWEFLIYNMDDFTKIFSGYAQKYGSVYRLWIGKELVVGLSDLQHVEEVFRNPKVLAKPKLFQGFHRVWKNSIFTAPMHVWRRTRKRLQPMFAKSVVKFQTPLINESVDKYVKLMRNEIDGPEFDLNTYMPRLAVDSFIRIHFDLNISIAKNHYFNFHDILKLVGQNGVSNILIPWLRINFIHHFYFKKSLSAAIAKIKEFINMLQPLKCLNALSRLLSIKIQSIKLTFVRQIKDTKLPEAKENWDVKEVKIETLAKSLLSTVKSLQEELKIDNYLFQEIGLMVCAAADTTSITASYFLLCVGMYPKIQERLYDEICDIFAVNDDRPVTSDDLLRLPYLDQVVKETQRRFTLVPVIFRDVEEDIKIGSMIIPSGTTLMVRIGDIHLNPDLYPNPLEFNPENFSPEAISRRSNSKYSWIPFSAGTRDCIGKVYAETAMKIMLVGLLRNFKFSTTTKMEDIEYILSFTVGKRGGYWVSITSR